ncbi:MAG: porin family protein [Muribaculaceae bacterium]|nr:porin family protein [Bacteroidales bacterium]MDY6186307.1 porin family protein [Muribaculaceae bacterium]
MKEDRLKDIRDKMSDYEAEVPQDLWSAIDSAVGRRQQKKLWIRAGRYAAAAVVVAAIGLGIYILQPDSSLVVHSESNPNTRAQASANNAPAVTSDDADPGNNSAAEIRASEFEHTPYATLAEAKPVIVEGVEGTSSMQIKSDGESLNVHPVDSNESASEAFTHSLPPISHEVKQDKTVTYNSRQRDRQQQQEAYDSGRLAASIYTTAGTGGTSMQRYTSFGLMGIDPGDANWKDDPYMGMLVTNKGHLADRRVRHRLPVHAGASIAYRINDRVSVETGIAYSYLSADIHEGSDSYYFAGEQSLHYVGIPVGVRIRAMSWKNFDIYVGAGFEADKCVSGTLKKSYVINGQTRDDGHESISIRPLQWSVNAGAGVQYNISSMVGIYAEPGLSYYFDNGSNIETIYSEKPLNFNLNIGLRVSFGSR